MKKILCFLLFGILCFNLSAQDMKAKAVLDKVSAKNKEFKSIQAEFTFTIENTEEDINEVSEGNIILVGNKYRLKLMGADVYFDGTTTYTHQIEIDEVNITEPDEDEEESLDPAKIFTIYEEGFNYKYIKEETKDNIKLHVIDLIPDNTDTEYSSIRIKINKANNQISSLKTFGKDGNNISIVLINFTPNQTFPDSQFVFNTKLHKDVEVNDMR